MQMHLNALSLASQIRKEVFMQVVRIEDEAELNLGGVAADVTMMFRGAQACGLPASILQRAAARFKKIMAAQSTNNQ